MKFVELSQCKIDTGKFNESREAKMVETGSVVVNLDHVVSFNTHQGSSGLPIGHVQMDVAAGEWDLSYQVTPDSIKRLREATQ